VLSYTPPHINREINQFATISKFHELFAQNFPGGHSAFQEAVRERADWSPLQIFENTKNDSWGVGHEKFNALGPVIQCPANLLQSLGAGDEEKRICGEMTSDDCVVISLGSNNQWDFEINVVKKHPNCRIHTLDCTLEVTIPAEIRSHVTFHPVCLGTTDTIIGNRQFLSWSSVTRRIGLQKPPTVMKMDIEGYEWTAIPAIVKASVHVPESFSFELHYETYVEALPWKGRQRTDAEIGMFMELLFSLGYLLVDRHDNAECGCCSELVIAKLAPSTRFPHHHAGADMQSVLAGGVGHGSVLHVDPYPTTVKRTT
jgi:hypothetical protein